MSSTDTRASRIRWGGALLAIAMLGRLPALLYNGPIDDETIYSVVARVMVAGGAPYQDAIERKPPLLFGVYASVFNGFGAYNWFALHVVGLLWVLATMAGLYAAGKALSRPSAGVWAALLYCVVQPWGTWKNLALNGEVLMNLPLAWAFALLFQEREGRPLSIWRPFVSGALVVVAALLKQPAAIAAVPMLVYLGLRARERSDGRFGAALGQAVAMVAGAALTTAIVGVELWRRHILADAFYWTVTDHVAAPMLWDRALMHTAGFMLAAAPLLAPLAYRNAHVEAFRHRRAAWQALWLWVAVSAVGAAAGGRFYPHYYLQLLPPLALLAGVTYAGIHERAQVAPWLVRERTVGAWLALSMVVFGVLGAAGLPRSREFEQAGAFVAARTRPGDRIFVWGQAPHVYIEADRLPASRYIATFPLTGYLFAMHAPREDTERHVRPGAWQHLADDFRAHPPAFIVDTEVQPESDFPLAGADRLLALMGEHYRLAARFDDSILYERCC